jgi:hypothetical protein
LLLRSLELPSMVRPDLCFLSCLVKPQEGLAQLRMDRKTANKKHGKLQLVWSLLVLLLESLDLCKLHFWNFSLIRLHTRLN